MSITADDDLHPDSVSDGHVVKFESLVSPEPLQVTLPVPAEAAATVRPGRRDIAAVLAGADDRLVVITGPCSIHDPEAALDYARRLNTLAADLVTAPAFCARGGTLIWTRDIREPDMGPNVRPGSPKQASRSRSSTST